jgi:hypothetical protein
LMAMIIRFLSQIEIVSKEVLIMANIIVYVLLYTFVWPSLAEKLGVKYIRLSQVRDKAKQQVCRAIDALDPEYCHIAYKLCRAVQFACVVGIVFNVLFTKDILDSVLGIAVTIMFIVGMNKVCKRIVERF